MGKREQQVLINGAFASIEFDRDRERKGEKEKRGGKKSGVGAVMQAFEVWQSRGGEKKRRKKEKNKVG